jgi:pantoate--beta-alanine ligase
LFGSEIKICPIPTVRGSSGLALSSRNAYLTVTEKRQAEALYQTLRGMRKAVRGRKDSVSEVLKTAKMRLREAPGVRLQYLEILDAERLGRVRGYFRAGRRWIAAGAVFIGRTRLIDNIRI